MPNQIKYYEDLYEQHKQDYANRLKDLLTFGYFIMDDGSKSNEQTKRAATAEEHSEGKSEPKGGEAREFKG